MNPKKDRALYTINFILDVLNAAEEQLGADRAVTTKVKEDEKDSREQLFEGIDDDGVAVGKKVRITSDLQLLLAKWKESELQATSDLKSYLNLVGEILAVREDDDSVNIRLDDDTSVFVPIKACHSSR